MKKMKKILAMLLALTMVLGMGLTSMAATDTDPNTGNIIVKGLDANEITTVELYPVVYHDATNSSWAVKEWVTEAGVSINLTNDPISIDYAALMDYVKDNSVTDVKRVLTSEIGTTEVLFENLPIGAYLIYAHGTLSDYNAMGAALYTYDATTHLITAPATNETVWAKYSSYDVKKELAEGSADDAFVARGDEVVFDITATFPTFEVDKATGIAEGEFSITDTPTGLKITNIVVKVGGTTDDKIVGTNDYTLSTELPANGPVTVSFTNDFIGTTKEDANQHAGQTVIVTVTATVTSEGGYTNTANTSETEVDEGSTVTGYTGDLTLKKYSDTADKQNLTANDLLKGAQFEVYKGTKDSNNGSPLAFVKISDGVYKLSYGDEADAKTTVEATNGTVQIKGLDLGKYWFKETKAPAGYSINENGLQFEIIAPVDDPDTTDKDESKAHVSLSNNLFDTQLIALPSTGGIGTTIFTVAGCGIMIAAAFFFFASRKKES